jgi:predicted transcriptional regulator
MTHSSPDRDDFTRWLDSCPEDDEPLSWDERAALARSDADIAEGRTVSFEAIKRHVDDLAGGYDPVILFGVKTAISVPDDTFRRVDDAAKRLGVSRSEFFSRAAEKALDALDDDGTTEAINRAIAGLPADNAFTDAAAAALAASDQR